jgi:ribosomal protein L24E
MKEICETCGKEIEVEPEDDKIIVIYFCSEKCEKKMSEVMAKMDCPVRFVE